MADLNIAKTNKKDELTLAWQSEMTAGITVTSIEDIEEIVLRGGFETYQMLRYAEEVAKAKGMKGVTFRDSNDIRYTVHPFEFSRIMESILTWGDNLWVKKCDLQEQVDACLTEEEIDLISW